jgi:CBS-domain-containing membrane protein
LLERFLIVSLPDHSNAGTAMKRFVHIHKSKRCLRSWAKAGIGTFAAFAVALLLEDITCASMIVAPMGASAALIFGLPQSPVSQPAHVIGGHLVAAIAALAANHYLPSGPWMIAGTIGAIIALQGALHLNHPPAAATALVVLLTHPGWTFVLTPLLSGMLTLVAVAVAIHRLPPRVTYPLPVAAATSP